MCWCCYINDFMTLYHRQNGSFDHYNYDIYWRVYRFTKPIQVKYTLFASKYSGSKVSRVQFSESASTTDQSTLTKIIAVNEQQSSSGQNCEKHLAYIPVITSFFYYQIVLPK